MLENCPLCETIALGASQSQPLLIQEFKHSMLFFGQHQFYSGYCVLVAKKHARELHHLPQEVRDGIWQELMQAGNAIDQVFKPWKLNYASYGNQVEHIHWHIFPRYTDDPHHLDCPFVNSAKFANHATDSHQLSVKRDSLRQLLIR